jgi:hypothetical protein
VRQLVDRDCNWCGAHVPHAAGRGGGPIAHIRDRAVFPCRRRRETTAEERAEALAELLEYGLDD